MDLLVAHGDHLLVARVGLDDRRPAGELAGHRQRQVVLRAAEQRVDPGAVGPGPLELGTDLGEPLHAAGGLGIPRGVVVVAAHRLGDLGEVAHPLRRHDLAQHRRVPHRDRGERALPHLEARAGEQAAQLLVERGHPVVVERGGRRAEDRHVVGPLAERPAVAHHLPADVAQRVHGAAPLELVDRDDVGEVEHVDLLELAGRTELRRHDVEVDVGERRDRGVALADAGRLDDDEVEPGRPEDGEHVAERLGHLAPAAGRERAEVDAVAVERVHPDAVAEQGAPAAAAGGVDRDAGDAQLVLLVDPQAAHELVGEARLARATGAGDAEHRGAAGGGRSLELGAQLVAELPGLGRGDGAGDRGRARRRARPPRWWGARPTGRCRRPATTWLTMPGSPSRWPSCGAEDRDAGGAQPLDLARDDDPAAAADDLARGRRRPRGAAARGTRSTRRGRPGRS